MCFRGASLQCSCPSYRAAERETLVGPGGGGRGLLMVDWMVEVRPEAEDFDWRTGDERQPAVVSLVFILFSSVGILRQICFSSQNKICN